MSEDDELLLDDLAALCSQSDDKFHHTRSMLSDLSQSDNPMVRRIWKRVRAFGELVVSVIETEGRDVDRVWARIKAHRADMDTRDYVFPDLTRENVAYWIDRYNSIHDLPEES